MFKVEENIAVNLQLTHEQLNRLFPYHILLTRNLRMISVGYKLQELHNPVQLKGLLFSDYFTTHAGETTEITFDTLLSRIETSITISNQQISLSAQIECNVLEDTLLLAVTTFIIQQPKKDLYVKEIFERIGDNFWEHDFRTGITTFSKKQLALIGAGDNGNNNNAELWWSSVDKKYKTLLEENDRKYRAGVIDSHTLEYELRQKDGSLRWVLDRGTVVEKDTNGKPLKVIGTHTDITHLKQTEAALIESEKKFKSISDSLPGAIYQCAIKENGQVRFTYLSPSIEKLFGITVEKFSSSTEHIHPQDFPAFIEAGNKTIFANEPFYYEGRLITPSGQVKWHSASAHFSGTNELGERILTGIILDITERKIAEELLRKSEKRFKNLTQNVPGVVYEWEERPDGTYGFNYVSPKLKDYFGIDPADMHLVAEMLHPDDKERWRKSIEKANAGDGVWEFEGRLLYPDGQIKWWRGVSIRSEKINGVHTYNGILQNITAQKEAEIKVRKAEDLYKFALEGSGDGVWEFTFSSGEIFYSSQYKKLLGYSEDEYANDPDLWIKQIHPEDLKRVIVLRDQYPAGQIERHSIEYRIKKKDGSFIWVLDRGIVIEKTAEGKAERIIGTIEDISDSKKLENDLLTSLKRMSDLIDNLQEGILFENETGHVVLTNQKFFDILDISYCPEMFAGMLSKDVIRHCKNQFKEPGNFEKLVSELVSERKNVTSIILELKNEKLLELDSIPIFINDQYKGQLWKYADVSEKILSEKQLEIQKKFYEDVLNGIPADIAVLNDKRQYLYVNPYAIKDAEIRKWIIGKTDEEFCTYRKKPIQIAEKRKALFNEVATLGQQKEWEEKNITSSGKALHYLRKLYPVLNEKGNVKFIIGYGIDITERKKYEDQLLLSEKRYRDLFNFGQALICTHDLNGKIISVNPAVTKLLQYESEEMVGKYIYDFIPEEDKIYFLDKYLKPFDESDNVKGVFCVISKAGQKNYLLYQNYKVQEEGNEPYIIGFSQDITERKKIEEVIRSGEEKYKSIIENMNLGMVELDKDSTIIFTNDNLSRMTGFTKDELYGKKLYNVFSEGESRHFIKQKMYLKNKGVSEVYEFITKNKQGESRWWLVSGVPLFSGSGEFKGSLVICLDISQQKLLEQQLRDAKQQAEESSRAKELFLANMSHEIRTPMNAILGMGSQLQKTRMDEKQQFYLDSINSAASNLLVIINDILDFSKIEAGKMTLDNVGFEMQEIINKALQVINHKAEEKGLEISSVIDPNIAPVLIGDPYRINQVLINLLGNSVKFTEKGSVRIHCSLAEDNKDHQKVQIEVVDTGIGMSDEFINSLFDKFIQEDDRNGKKYAGTGLGMSIVKELVELMKGSISVESKKNIGTLIKLNLPFIKGSNADLPKKPEKKINSKILSNKKVLLVEDNEMNRVLAKIVLSQYSAIVDEAVNGEQAVAAVRNNHYDIILMDMRMPVMDGVEATHIIRNEISKDIPIIALTANAVVGEKQKCLDAGMNDFLVKPFEEEELVQVMAKWLGIETYIESINRKKKEEMNAPLFTIKNLLDVSRGKKEFVAKMLNIFIKEASLSLQNIREAEKNGDILKISSTAHKIKPSLNNMGVFSVKDEILKLEALANNPEDIQYLPEIINKVELVLQEVINQISQMIISENF